MSYNFNTIEIPKNKKPERYNYRERRAEIITLILEAGHPGSISQTKLAQRYGVTQPQIHKDINAIKKLVIEKIGNDAKFISEIVYRKAIKEYMKNEEYEKAIRVLESWNGWLFSVGAQDKVPEGTQNKPVIRIVWGHEEYDEGEKLED